MKGILRRPLALCSGVFLLLLFILVRMNSMGGILPTALLSIMAFLLAAAALVSGLLFSLFHSRLRTPLFYLALLFLAISLALFAAWRVAPRHTAQSLLSFEEQTVDGILTVDKVESATSYSTSLICTLHSIEGKPIDLQGRLLLPYPAQLSAGDKISLSFIPRLLQTDGTLADCYNLSQGIYFDATGSNTAYTLLSNASENSANRLQRIGLSIRRALYPYLSDEEIGLSSALLLGDKSSLSDDLQSAFRNLGISHTLAVSGLHLGILFGSLLWVFRKLGVPRCLHMVLLLPLLFVYSAMVGSASVLRAGGMLLLVFTAYPLGRRQDSITSLFATVTVICLIFPYSILDIGLLLSFFATWGILLIVPTVHEKLRLLPAFPRSLFTALAVTLSAMLFTLPFTVWYFGEWAILSLAANLIAVPVITLLLYLIPLLLLLSPIPILAATPTLLIHGITYGLQAIAEFLGGNDQLLLPLDYPLIQGMAFILLIVIPLLCLFSKTRPLTLAVLVAFFSVSGGYCLYRSNTLLQENVIVPITDGGNDCLLVRDGTRTLLIDRSKGGFGFLSDAIERGETDRLIRVDAILLTEYHFRQISTLTRLLQQGHIEYLILPNPSEKDQNTAEILMERARTMGCHVELYSPDYPHIDYHGYEITIAYYPDNSFRSITLSLGSEQIIYSIDVDDAILPNYLPAQYGTNASSVPPSWNQQYTFPADDS